MNKVITTIEVTTPLFRQPHKIGDVLEYKDSDFLILGIQYFRIIGYELTVWYTCQNLKETDFISLKKAYEQPHMVEAEVKFKYDDRRQIKRFQLGTVHHIESQAYQIVEYTDVKFDGGDLFLSFIIKPLYPVDRKEARAKYLQERKNKLNFEVV